MNTIDKEEHIAIKPHIIHAHGTVETTKELTIAKNVYLVMLCGLGLTTVSDDAHGALLHLQNQPCFKDMREGAKAEDMYCIFDTAFQMLSDIMSIDGNRFCLFEPNTKIKDITFSGDNTDFASMIVSLPYTAASKATQAYAQSLPPSESHSLVQYGKPEIGPLLPIKDECSPIHINHNIPLSSILQHVSNDKHHHIFFVITCREAMDNVTDESQGIPIMNSRQCASTIVKGLCKDLDYENASTLDKDLCMQVKSMKLCLKRPLADRTNHRCIKAKHSGGTALKAYKIHTERITSRKYVLVSKKKWYLDDNRGKYRYTNKDKTHITRRKNIGN